MEYKIALISGDGIGPEIVAEAKKVLDKRVPEVSSYFLLLQKCSWEEHPLTFMGYLLQKKLLLMQKLLMQCLMGSIGGDAKTSPWYKLEPSKRPEAGLLAIRKALNLVCKS